MIGAIRSPHHIDTPLFIHPSMTVNSLLQAGTARLADAGVAHAETESRWIVEFVLGLDRLALQLNKHDPVSAKDQAAISALFDRRASREPLQYLLGTQEFYGLEFEVNADVLIPRQETELLVDLVRGECGSQRGLTIADIGTGSGCIAVALARTLPTATLYATDCSAKALEVAKQNAVHHGVVDCIVFEKGDLFEPMKKRMGMQFAAIVSNPPYISTEDLGTLQPEVLHEPRLALDGGADGFVFHRRLLKEAVAFLAPNGLLAIEVGQGQAPTVCALAQGQENYYNVQTLKDGAGIERVIYLQRKRQITTVS